MVKVIETKYNGHLFRSRLEARWAVFFDALGIPYEYEKEGFELGDGLRYLPDFWLPLHDCWVEIKPANPDEKEREKALRLAEQSGKFVFLFKGDVAPIVVTGWPDFNVLNGALYFAPDGDIDGCIEWGHCPRCERFVLGFLGDTHAVSFRHTTDALIPHSNCSEGGRDFNQWHSSQLTEAYAAARQARFEFGARHR